MDVSTWQWRELVTGASRGPLLAMCVLTLLGALATAFVLVSVTRWWTLRQLNAQVLWSLVPTPPKPGVFGIALVLMVVFWLLAALLRLGLSRWHGLLAVATTIGLLLTGLLITAAAGAGRAPLCRPNMAITITSMVTGLGLDCVRFRFRDDESRDPSLPTEPVLLIEQNNRVTWFFDPATEVLHQISPNPFVTWEPVTAQLR